MEGRGLTYEVTFDALANHTCSGWTFSNCIYSNLQKTPIRVRREKRELPEAFFGDSQEEKDTVRTIFLRN